MAWLGSDLVFGKDADRLQERAQVRGAAFDVLAQSGQVPDEFAQEVGAFREAHPDAPEGELLARHARARRERAQAVAAVESRLATTLSRLDQGDLSQARRTLLELSDQHGGDDMLGKRIHEALAQVDGRQAALRDATIQRARTQARAAMEAEDYGLALGWARSITAQDGALGPEGTHAGDRLTQEVRRAAQARLERARAAMRKVNNVDARMNIMAETWPALAGTEPGRMLAHQIRSLLRRGSHTPARPAVGAPRGHTRRAGSRGGRGACSHPRIACTTGTRAGGLPPPALGRCAQAL